MARQVKAQVEATVEAPVVAPVEKTLVELMVEFKTKSALIRHLSSQGKKTGEIAKFMGIRYQHVRNVLITPVKKV